MTKEAKRSPKFSRSARKPAKSIRSACKRMLGDDSTGQGTGAEAIAENLRQIATRGQSATALQAIKTIIQQTPPPKKSQRTEIGAALSLSSVNLLPKSDEDLDERIAEILGDIGPAQPASGTAS
ncbi:MAG TPA: hypothetical protein VFQ00_01160 [Terriglobales bacterium]|nr:hypothetical protein [Terriglobales bacterium]